MNNGFSDAEFRIAPLSIALLATLRVATREDIINLAMIFGPVLLLGPDTHTADTV
ncbi:hypothetical protein N9O61_02935 [Octadecabacter sp.]|nr:hypothetical protein [Octadecabacter sp.]